MAHEVHSAHLSMRPEQARSLRAQLRINYLIGNTRRVRQDRELLRRYSRGVGLLELSEQLHYPPVALFRVLLQCRGLNTNEIKLAISKPDESKRLSDYDRQQLELAFSADYAYDGDRRQQSQDFEVLLSTFFEAQGALLYREEELMSKQQPAYGGPVLTPDILFRNKVVINGQPVAWVDAKDFYGSALAIAGGKHAAQIEKYTAEWGPGALVFHSGFSDSLVLKDGCQALDGSHLPSSFAGTAMLKLRAGMRWGWRTWLSATQSDDTERMLARKTGARVLAQQAKRDELRERATR